MSCGAPSIESHARALARFEAHRRAWQGNAALRTLYADWYGRIRAKLPDRSLGPVIEIGSGPGLSAEFIDGLELSDVVAAPWLHRVFPAEAIPCEDGSVGALVLFDVLHHLAAPARFFGEASRVLRPGGRIVICEPHVGLLSYPVYRYLHEEPVVLSADPLADNDAGRDPFDGNQAIPTRLFCQERRVLEERFPALSLRSVDYFAGSPIRLRRVLSPALPSPWPLEAAALAGGRTPRAVVQVVRIQTARRDRAARARSRAHPGRCEALIEERGSAFQHGPLGRGRESETESRARYIDAVAAGERHEGRRELDQRPGAVPEGEHERPGRGVSASAGEKILGP
ncbi:MAG: class I SAM-dependent methyltransferase [Acidobacteriota bacterium]